MSNPNLNELEYIADWAFHPDFFPEILIVIIIVPIRWRLVIATGPVFY